MLIIIILVVLIGITIKLLIGSGLFKKAQDAKELSTDKTATYYSDEQNKIAENSTLETADEEIPYFPDEQSKVIENSTLKNGLVVADKNNNEWVWIEVPKAITASASSDDEIEKALQDYALDYRKKPSTERYKWKDEWYEGCGLTELQYNENKSKMLHSIKENGGFWISRYEAGIEGSVNKPELARMDKGEITASSPKAVSKQDHIPYNYVTCSQAQILASDMTPDSSRTSSLLFGIQWDLVCKFLEVKSELSITDIKNDSSSWGNYNGTQLTITSKNTLQSNDNGATWSSNTGTKLKDKSILLTTGASSDTKVMNIYDFAGNFFEWTLEKSTVSVSPCAYRGGYWGQSGYAYPAYCRYSGGISTCANMFSFRVSIY